MFSVGFLEFNEKRKKNNMWYQAIQGEVEVQKKEKRQQRGMSFKISTTLFRELLSKTKTDRNKQKTIESKCETCGCRVSLLLRSSTPFCVYEGRVKEVFSQFVKIVRFSSGPN